MRKPNKLWSVRGQHLAFVVVASSRVLAVALSREAAGIDASVQLSAVECASHVLQIGPAPILELKAG